MKYTSKNTGILPVKLPVKFWGILEPKGIIIDELLLMIYY
jgi:hypothetical protein